MEMIHWSVGDIPLGTVKGENSERSTHGFDSESMLSVLEPGCFSICLCFLYQL